MRHEIDTRNPHSHNHAFCCAGDSNPAVAQEQQENNHMHTFGGSASNGIPTLNNRGIAIPGVGNVCACSPTCNRFGCGGFDGLVPFIPHGFERHPPLGLDGNGGSID
jgi:hypothetical protein